MIAKCLAVMDRTVMLSEIHPSGRAMLKHRGHAVVGYLPLVQARDWFGLFSGDEVEEFKRSNPARDFTGEIAFIERRCQAKEKNLVLRDLNNLDFAGIRYRANPPFRFSTVEALQEQFGIIRFFTVRHPAHQWISLSRLFKRDITPELEQFLLGVRLFAEEAAEVGFVRYEDFAQDPEAALRRICEALVLPYDATWTERWADYKTITGDPQARGGEDKILPANQSSLDPDLQDRLERNADYRTSLELLGYRA